MTLLCVERKTLDDGQRNCPKHVEFYSKNKFEKLVHLVAFIIRIYQASRKPALGFIIRTSLQEKYLLFLSEINET